MRSAQLTILALSLVLVFAGGCPEAAGTCQQDSDCRDGELCQAGTCRRACNADLDCLRSERCVEGLCLAEVDAATPLDAGPLDRRDDDAHSPPDATPAEDAAVPPDGASPRDAASVDQGNSADAALPIDAAAVDTGAPVDSSADSDASTDFDGSLTPDSSTATDAISGSDGSPLVDVPAAEDSALPDAGPSCQGSNPLSEPCPTATTDIDLRACYSFDNDVSGETFFTVPDESGADNTGEGWYISHVTGVHGQAAVFFGAGYVEVQDSTSLDILDQVTVEFWVKPSALPAAGARAGLVDNNGQYAVFLFDDGRVGCALGHPDWIYSEPIALNQWAHVACTVDNLTTQLYLNGEHVDSGTRAAPIGAADTEPMRIGSNSPDGEHFEGLMDTVRIWADARSPRALCWAAQR